MQARLMQHACTKVILLCRASRQQAVWSTWTALHVYTTRLRVVCCKILARWGRLQLAAPLCTWHEQARRLRRLTRTGTTIVVRCQRQRMLGAWNGWLDHRASLIRLTHAARTIVLRWRQHGMVRAWAAWRHVLNLACRLKMMGRKIVQRWMRLGLAFAFVPWHHCYVANARLAYVARKISDAHAKAVCLQVVATWCVEAHMNAALHLRGCQLEGKGKYALHMRGFGAWAMHATLARRLRLRTLRVCCRYIEFNTELCLVSGYTFCLTSHTCVTKNDETCHQILQVHCAV